MPTRLTHNGRLLVLADAAAESSRLQPFAWTRLLRRSERPRLSSETLPAHQQDQHLVEQTG